MATNETLLHVIAVRVHRGIIGGDELAVRLVDQNAGLKIASVGQYRLVHFEGELDGLARDGEGTRYDSLGCDHRRQRCQDDHWKLDCRGNE